MWSSVWRYRKEQTRMVIYFVWFRWTGKGNQRGEVKVHISIGFCLQYTNCSMYRVAWSWTKAAKLLVENQGENCVIEFLQFQWIVIYWSFWCILRIDWLITMVKGAIILILVKSMVRTATNLMENSTFCLQNWGFLKLVTWILAIDWYYINNWSGYQWLSNTTCCGLFCVQCIFLRREVAVHFVDIGGIVDLHRLFKLSFHNLATVRFINRPFNKGLYQVLLPT